MDRRARRWNTPLMTDDVVLTIDELASMARAGDLAETVGNAVGVPVVVVAGPAPANGTDLGPLCELLGSLPCVLVAEPGAPDALGPFVDVRPSADEVGAVVALAHRMPLAATTFALLLRHAEERGVAAGLVAESSAYSVLQAGPEFAAWRAGRPPRARPAGDQPLLLDRTGDVLVVTFDRPAVHNALDAALRDALCEALRTALPEPGLQVVLRGNGPSFCSGGDLDEFGMRPDPATAHLVRLARSPARLVHQLADRVEVRVHGACMGSGIELAAFAAHIVADPETRFGLPEIGLGLVPGAGGTVSLPRRIGRHRTALLALRGDPIDAATALAWGLIDEVAPR
jgi:Enoyl-CoA hydratase/isomerase